jgi:monoamine oxidase
MKKVLKKRDEIILKENLTDEEKNLSVGEVFDQLFLYSELKNWKETDPDQHYFDFLKWIYEEYEGSNFENISLLLFGTESIFDGGNTTVPSGYIEIINKLAEGLQINLETVVESIYNYIDGPISILTNKGEYKCKKVVVSIPLPCLKYLKFSPSLPSRKLEVIEKLKMGLMNKVVLKFPYFFWDRSVARYNYISNIKGEFPWFDSLSETEPILLCWIACEYAEEIQKLDDKEVITRILDILIKMFSHKEIPYPCEYLITKWGLDQYSQGSWSGNYNFISYIVRPKGSKTDYNEILGENLSNLYFCGEATTSYYFGTAHGAYLTGFNAANKIINNL